MLTLSWHEVAGLQLPLQALCAHARYALLLNQTGAFHMHMHVPKKDHSFRTCLYTENVSKVLEKKWASPSCLLLLLNI